MAVTKKKKQNEPFIAGKNTLIPDRKPSGNLLPQDRIDLLKTEARKTGSLLEPVKVGNRVLTGENYALEQMRQNNAIQNIFTEQQKRLALQDKINETLQNPEFLNAIKPPVFPLETPQPQQTATQTIPQIQNTPQTQEPKSSIIDYHVF